MKKGFTLTELIGVVIILALLALLSFPSILKMMKGTKIELSEASKEILYNATANYIKDNPNAFFRNNGNVYCISVETLTKNNYLSTKIYDSTTGNELPQDSLVEAKYEHDKFDYVLNNDCVESILKSSSLISILLSQYSEKNETGLLKDKDNPNLYYYTGTNEDVNNNYLWYGGHQWRVLEFDTNVNTLTLVTQQPLTAIQPASAEWETQEAYESSYINTWLNDYFWNSLDSSIKDNILNSTFNIGIYTDVDEITTIQKVGLLDEEQYKRAGNTNSFLNIEDYFWLGNRDSSSNIRVVDCFGYLNHDSVSIADGVRAVIKISDITITGGAGTLTSNYQVGNKATNTNNVQVGEYINVPYSGSDSACGNDNMCTFRVVSKDEDSIKVVLNGLLPTTSKWADNANDNITTNDLIYTNVLNGFIENIDSKYITTGTYRVGMYEAGNSYTTPQSTTITANVGLPTVGEMFSGNDIDMTYPTDGEKTFVDVNAIENPTVSNYYWTMNRGGSSHVVGVFYDGTLYYNVLTHAQGVRAVIYLKSGTSAITFTGGEGTPNSPYVLQ